MTSDLLNSSMLITAGLHELGPGFCVVQLVSGMSGKLLVEHGQLIVRKYARDKNDKVGRPEYGGEW